MKLYTYSSFCPDALGSSKPLLSDLEGGGGGIVQVLV
jgi:hypothetical protein